MWIATTSIPCNGARRRGHYDLLLPNKPISPVIKLPLLLSYHLAIQLPFEGNSHRDKKWSQSSQCIPVPQEEKEKEGKKQHLPSSSPPSSGSGSGSGSDSNPVTVTFQKLYPKGRAIERKGKGFSFGQPLPQSKSAASEISREFTPKEGTSLPNPFLLKI